MRFPLRNAAFGRLFAEGGGDFALRDLQLGIESLIFQMHGNFQIFTRLLKPTLPITDARFMNFKDSQTRESAGNIFGRIISVEILFILALIFIVSFIAHNY